MTKGNDPLTGALAVKATAKERKENKTRNAQEVTEDN